LELFSGKGEGAPGGDHRQVNDLFEGDLTDDDQLVYVNNAIKGKLLECQELVIQVSIHSSLYLPEPVYEALRETAFHERRKIHDLIMEGIDAVLKKRRDPSVEDLKAGRKR
jgi:hypothetical protein